MKTSPLFVVSFILASLLVTTVPTARAQSDASFFTTEPAAALAWDARIQALHAATQLELVAASADELVAGWTHERFQQRYRGLRVFGAQLLRHSYRGRADSVNGLYYENIDLDTTAGITPGQAAIAAERAMGATGFAVGEAELLVYPFQNRFVLAYALHVRLEHDLQRVLIDASNGDLLDSWSDLQTQTAVVGTGLGTWEDIKKISVTQDRNSFFAQDLLRPATSRTVDVSGMFQAWNRYLIDPRRSMAEDKDNDWRDSAVVDAHVYAGWTYDYYFKRFGRDGPNGNNGPVTSYVHFWRRTMGPSPLLNNAFYDPTDNSVNYGDGDGRILDHFSGALEVVAHEITHAVSRFTNGLTNRNEPGALGEHFSDVMGTAVEFFFEERGSGRQRADWVLGEDLFIHGSFRAPTIIRSMENPRSVGDPDHYSVRFTGPQDAGGVHINAGIGNNAFYLFVEGGTNRTSGMRVNGIGFANRDRAEKIFYRAFTRFLGPMSLYRDLRRATLQSARDLYGANSVEERELTRAWDAVGVRP